MKTKIEKKKIIILLSVIILIIVTSLVIKSCRKKRFDKKWNDTVREYELKREQNERTYQLQKQLY